MACHEIAALRLGLMNILGRDNASERAHELAEIGDGLEEPGPIRSLTETTNLSDLQRLFESSVTDLEQRVARTPTSDRSLAYLRTLLVLTKKVELDLQGHTRALEKLFLDLDEVHDFVHEIYPAD